MQMTTQIDRLYLKNYRALSTLELELHPQLTVLVADNGHGKTAVLEAIAIALAPLVSGLELQPEQRLLAASDIRLVRTQDQTMELTEHTAVSIEGTIANEAIRWTVRPNLAGPEQNLTRTYLAQPELGRVAERLKVQVLEYAERQRPDPPDLPLVRYIGTRRALETPGPPSEIGLPALDPGGQVAAAGISPYTVRRLFKQPLTSRMSAYTDCLTGGLHFAAFADWFRDFSYEAKDDPTDNPSPHRPKERLEVVRNAMDIVLRPSGWRSVQWDFAAKNLSAFHPARGRLPVAWLSDGIRTLVELAGDLAYRCVRLNPHLGADAAAKTPGVVLIDEIDMHLHPAWQQIILRDLVDAFPLVQFVVTTHSPQVLSTVNAEHIRVISVDDAGFGAATTPTQQTRGVESAEVLAEVMGVDPVPHVPEAAWLSEYSHRVQDGTWEEPDAQALRAKLINHFGEKHPAIRRIDTLIAFKLSKRRIEAARTRE